MGLPSKHLHIGLAVRYTGDKTELKQRVMQVIDWDVALVKIWSRDTGTHYVTRDDLVRNGT